MSFRFLQFATLYPEFERQFLAANPDHAELSHQQLYERLVGMHFGLADVYVRHLRVHGCEAEYHCVSLEPLQKTWAREHGVNYGKRTWMRDIVLAQVRQFRADVLFLQDTVLFDAKFRQQLRDAGRRPIVLVGWRAAPTPDFRVFNDLDVILTAGPHFVEQFRHYGANAHLLPLAFDETVLDLLSPAPEQDLAFTFVGTVGTVNGPHASRYTLIESLLQTGLLEVWGDEPATGDGLRRAAHKTVYQINRFLGSLGMPPAARATLPVIRRGVDWQHDPTRPALRSRFSDRMHASAFGLDAFRILSRSKTTLNCHIGAAGKYAGNNRLFEATGVGACLVTDWKEDLDRYFKPDIEVVTFRSPEECADKVRYLLQHDCSRKAIAAAGQRRTLREHSYAGRAQLLIDVIQSTMAGNRF
jgi:spore maturation protein CgeB